jgi:hypothetical protein
MTTSCIDAEVAARSKPSTDDDEIGPKVVNEYIIEEEVTDSDFKSKYQVAVGVFTVFFILLLVLAGVLLWLFIKKRREVQAEVT